MEISAYELDGPSAEMWADLRAYQSGEWGSFQAMPLRREGQVTDVHMAVFSDGSLALLLPYSGQLEDEFPISLKGLKAEIRSLRLESEEAARECIVLSSTSNREGMFTLIAREIADHVICEGYDSQIAIKNTVRRWKSFWANNRSSDLTHAQIVGLIGELWFLNDLLIPKAGKDAVMGWTGPKGERHDYQYSSVHFEVKTTEKEVPVFRVSGIDQLNPPHQKELSVATIQLRQETEGQITLNGLVKSIRKALNTHTELLELFHDRLCQTGYRLEGEEEYSKLKFQIRSAELYVVDDNFPRLCAGEIEIPSGVSSIEYDIDLSNVSYLCERERDRLISSAATISS